MRKRKQDHQAKKTGLHAIHQPRKPGAKLFRAAFKHTFGTKPLEGHYEDAGVGRASK